MSKNFRLSNSIKDKRRLSNNEDKLLEKLIVDVKKQNVELVRINFEIDKQLRQKLKSKVSAEGKQIKEVLIDLIEQYLNK